MKSLLLYQFIFYTLGIAFSCFGKYLRLIYEQFPTVNSTIIEYLFGLIWYLRLALCMMVFGIICSYKFKVELSDLDIKNNAKNRTVIGIGAIIASISVLLYQKGVNIYSLIVFGLIFIYNAAIYLPLLLNSIHLANRIEDKAHKKAIFYIAVMAFCLVSIFLSFLLDQLMLVFYSARFSIFYYLAWVWAIIGFISSYFGYMKPAK